ncbi:MAG: serine protease [Solirubrobacteraceae bacterium]|nr:serine protease [Solirubrobacteraceae bacterium]
MHLIRRLLRTPFWGSSLIAASVIAASMVAASTLAAAPASAADYVPGQVIVGYAPVPAPSVASVTANIAHRMGARIASAAPVPAPGERVLRLPRGLTVSRALSRLRHQPGVAYAVPNYVAHVAGSWIPNDPGRSKVARGWESMQWNFLPGFGVDAPAAWANLRADRRPGGSGVTIAILDTGVAYRDWRNFKRSPDFGGTKFVKPKDFVARNSYPLDREGHGTFVAGLVAESTNNRIGLTGLAYGATIMPVRILAADGTGDAATISQGIRYAATHGAQVINLSLEFSLDVTSSDIPDIISAIRFAHRRGVVVVAASGNEGVAQVAYPAHAPEVISVGATTKDRCLANYSNGGSRLDLVAPGGGNDTSLLSDPNCHPTQTLPNISQLTFFDSAHPARFGYPGGWYGTSMAAPHVAAAAALVIASGVIGAHPTPDQVLARLETTAQTLGGVKPNPNYGYGLLDAGAASASTATAAKHSR